MQPEISVVSRVQDINRPQMLLRHSAHFINYGIYIA
jgi:hypothetical protein